MSFAILVIGLEVVIIAGSGIDARWRPEGERQLWPVRWLAWHVAPLWLLWLTVISAVLAAAMHEAQRSYRRHLQREAEAPPVRELTDL